jgi:uncharacterized damage-inducible protein DinB
MNVEDFQTLYAYNAWANRRTVDSCEALDGEKFTRDLGSSFRSVRDTLVHILGAEWVWLERWRGRTPTSFLAATEFPDLHSVRRHWAGVESELLDFVGGLSAETIGKVIAYKLMTGAAYAEALGQSLQHMANHGTYHRGQIATMLRQLDAKPASTDLIVFYRQRAANITA